MRSRIGGFVSLLMLLVFLGCGGGTSGGAVGTQYTLDTSATISIAPAANAGASLKLETPTPQVMIGTMLVEVQTSSADDLGIDILNFTLAPEQSQQVDIQLELRPTVTPTGIIFKLDEYGEPYGLSTINLDLVASSPSGIEFVVTPGTSLIEGGTLLDLGGFQAVADPNDRSKIPLLGDIPTIGFLFNGERHDAQVSELLILLTPQILQDTD